jgi:hypothetical protein
MKTKNPVGTAILRGCLDLLKGIAAALAGFVGVIAGGIAGTAIGLPTPVLPEYMDATRIMPLMLLSAVPFAILLGECFRQLPLRYGPRALASAVCTYILFYLVNLLDAFLFNPMTNMSTGFFSNLFPAAATGLVVAALWKPPGDATRSYPAKKREGLPWRVALAWLGYVPIYYLIGLLVVPFTRDYYTDPSHSLGLVLPPLGVILLMQVVRGGLFLLAVLPVIFGWRGSRTGLWLWTGALIFFAVAAPILFQSYWLPAAVRVPHAVELLVDSLLQAGLYTLLLGPAARHAGESTRGAVGRAVEAQ